MADNDEQAFRTEVCLHVADVLWSCFLITPLTVFYWAGTWKLMDHFIFPGNTVYSAVVSLAIGTVVCLAGYLLMPFLDRCRPVSTSSSTITCSVRHILVSRTCIYVLAVSVLNYWRGLWNLTDHYLGTDSITNAICVGAACFVLLCFRALGNVVSSPFFMELDTSPHVYKQVTRFRAERGRFWVHLCDSLFSHLVINHMVVQVWRGLWNLMAKAILPGDRLLSYCVSLGAGMGGAFILFILQHPLALAGKQLLQFHWTAMLALQEVVHVAGTVITLLIWRGGWGLNRDYLLQHTLEAAVAHGLASAGLLLCQSLTSVSTLNQGVDAEGHSTDGFYYNIHYFWHFWSSQRRADLQIQVEPDDTSRGLLEESDDDLINPSLEP